MDSPTLNFGRKVRHEFFEQVSALFKKNLIIYWRNKANLIKELLLPMITALSIYAGQFGEDMFVPVQILFPISLLGHVRSFMVDVVNEKSEKYKEYLKINGVSSFAYLTSMLLFGYFKCVVYTLVTCSGFFFTSSTDTSISNGVVCLLYFMTAIASTHFALLFTAFFSSKQLCSDIGGFAYGILSFLFLIVMGSKTKKQLYYISLAFPQNALGYALFSETSTDLPIDSLTLAGFISLDGIVYLALFFYLDQVLPDAFGVRRSWLFCFGKCLRRKRDNEDALLLQQEKGSLMKDFTSSGEEVFQSQGTGYSVEIDPDREEDGSSALYHEKFENSMNLRRTVFLENVSKSFGSDKVIDNLSLMAYERQVFCLLGHNGAGKTTTINLLTGILNYDSGEIFYRGHSFHQNISSVRKTIGLCNQQDILYPDLTVEEHMELMGKIRGKSGVELYAEIQETMSKVGLTSERKKPAKTLSGGNRRKLSLGLAVLGGVRIVFLDEPTSGMDPNTRRFMWDLIKQLRDEGKTILLTTHHLDEADELSDRLAVMSKGRVFAIGAPEFIKKKFGVGYHLEVTPNYDKNCTPEQFEDLKPKISEVVNKYIESARPDEQVGTGVIRFLLPFAFQYLFPQLFEELEKFEDVKLNLRMNSLEDAFINIGLQDELLFQEGFQSEIAQSNINIEPPRVVKTHIPRYDVWQQIEAMWQRKFFYTVRNYKNLILIILPVLFVVFGTMLTVNGLRPYEEGQPPSQSTENGDYQPQFEAEVIERIIIVFFLFMVNFAYSLNTTIYCAFPVYEREHNITYMLRVTGCQNKPYWIGTFIFDFIVIQIVNIALVGLVFIFQIETLKDSIFAFALTIVLYSGALVTASYFWGFVFQSANTVYKSYAAFYLFVVYTLPSIVLVLAKQSASVPGSVSTILTIIVFHCCPNFAFNDSIRVSLGHDALFLQSRFQCGLWLIWLTVFYILATLYIHKRKAKVTVKATRAIQDTNIDAGIGVDYAEMMAEATRIEAIDNKDPVKVMHLSKVYPNGFRAVRDLSFGTQKGEIFGLLGPNGAGKSTTFSIATAMISRSGGNVELNGQSIDGNLDDVFRDMSVCPQFDALWDELRVDEHLYLYAKIKGIERYDQSETIEYLLEALKLKEHRRKRAKELSGGSRRKLSTAMALIGSPYLKFLDEPSTGIDPMAKRFLWSCLRNFAAIRGGSTILTTHSMEEAEALCHRIGIIVNGGFVCIGPLQYLKDKYGSGYKVTVVRSPNVDDISGQLSQIFPEAKKIQDAATTIETYQMTSQSFKFSKALRALEDLKAAKMIKDFSIYNTTLEQVFINFSRHQLEPAVSLMTNSGW